MNDKSFLTMSNEQQRTTISDLERELEIYKSYQERYETFVEQIAASDEETQAQMTQGQIELINKNLNELNATYKKRMNEMITETSFLKNENKILKQYADGKISKEDLDGIMQKSLMFHSEFKKIKLRKLKVATMMEMEHLAKSEVVHVEKSKSISSLINRFNNSRASVMAQKRLQMAAVDVGNIRRYATMDEAGLFSDDEDEG